MPERPPVFAALSLKERELREVERAYWAGDLNKIKAIVSRLHDRSMQDGLTGLLNPMAFQEILQHAVRPHLDGAGRSVEQRENRRNMQGRRKGVMCVAQIDIDKLKSLNTMLGHMAVDTIIRRFAEILRGAFRKSDIIARTGGDEFTLFLPGAPVFEANRKLEQVLSDLRHEDWDMTLLDGTPFCPIVTFTYKAHAVENPKDLSSIFSSIYEADRSLIEQKEHRNEAQVRA